MTVGRQYAAHGAAGAGDADLYIAPDDFARRFAMRASNLMWFLGAGASAAGGVATAGDMIWEFKQALFITQRRVSGKSVDDLSNPFIRQQIQQHIDSAGNLPAEGADDEYASLFEATYASEADRRAYLDRKIAGAQASYGHVALATLMKAGQCKLVWTTNFDPLVADACARVFQTTGRLTSGGLESSEPLTQAVLENRWPIEIKLHGDFRSRRLRNTSDELREQDQRLRQLLVSTGARSGLIVVGYSGRDLSVMTALNEILQQPTPFPGGLFWLVRQGDPIAPKVVSLIERARQAGVDAGLIGVPNFDEALSDLVRASQPQSVEALEAFARGKQRWSPAPRPSGRSRWPVLRFNAIPITSSPSVCRLVECEIGGTREVRAAVESARTTVLAVRSRAGVLAFGSDADVRASFAQFGISKFDLHPIDRQRFARESSALALIGEALGLALQRNRGLTLIRGARNPLVAPVEPNDAPWRELSRIINGPITGAISGHEDLTWREGVSIRLEWAAGELWLVFDPRTIVDGITQENRSVVADFSRERSVWRYNRVLYSLIEFWCAHLSGEGAIIRALGVSDGVDAAFELGSKTAFSRRA